MKKFCQKCGNEKTTDQFRRDMRRPGGVGSVCLDCHRKRERLASGMATNMALSAPVSLHHRRMAERRRLREAGALTGHQCRVCGDTNPVEGFAVAGGQRRDICRPCDGARSRPPRRRVTARNRFKERARRATLQAVKRGVIPKSPSCERCGATSNGLEAHHHDYTKPLDVEWLCVRCHRREHRKYA